MKKKWIVLTAVLAAATMMAGSAEAKTYGVDDRYYTVETWTYDPSDDGMTEAEKEDRKNWNRAVLRERIACLEEFGVSYDEQEDALYYGGKRIRLLIDREREEDAYLSLQMPEGEIDLYLVRAENYDLIGVRPASREEFEKHTEALKGNEEVSADAVAVIEISDDIADEMENEASVTFSVQEAQDGAAAFSVQEVQDGAAAFSVQEAQDGTVTSEALEAFSNEGSSGGSLPDEREEEYAEAGIEKTEDGGWAYHGKRINWLVDENGGIFMSNNGEEKKDRVYVIVKRNEDGSVKEAEEVTLEEALKYYMVIE